MDTLAGGDLWRSLVQFHAQSRTISNTDPLSHGFIWQSLETFSDRFHCNSEHLSQGCTTCLVKKGLLKTQPEPPNLHFVPLLPPLPLLRKTSACSSLQLPFEELQAAVGLPALASPAPSTTPAAHLLQPWPDGGPSFDHLHAPLPLWTQFSRYSLSSTSNGEWISPACWPCRTWLITARVYFWIICYLASPVTPGPLQWSCFSGSRLTAGFSTLRTELCISPRRTSWGFF